MSYSTKKMIIHAVYVIVIFVAGMIGLVCVLDLVLLPVVFDVLRDSHMQNWCGTFSRCASGTQQTFIEYVWSGGPWEKIDLAPLKSRVIRAGFVGMVIGVTLVLYSIFSSRR